MNLHNPFKAYLGMSCCIPSTPHTVTEP